MSINIKYPNEYPYSNEYVDVHRGPCVLMKLISKLERTLNSELT